MAPILAWYYSWQSSYWILEWVFVLSRDPHGRKEHGKRCLRLGASGNGGSGCSRKGHFKKMNSGEIRFSGME